MQAPEGSDFRVGARLRRTRGRRRRIWWAASRGIWAVATATLLLLPCGGLHQGIKLWCLDQDYLHLGLLQWPLPPGIISGVQACCDLCAGMGTFSCTQALPEY